MDTGMHVLTGRQGFTSGFEGVLAPQQGPGPQAEGKFCPQRGLRNPLALEESEPRAVVQRDMIYCCGRPASRTLADCSSLYLCHPSLCQASFSSMADGSYLLTDLFPMPPTCSPCGTEVLLYSIDMVTILPGLCTAACEALSLQPTALPLILVTSAIWPFSKARRAPVSHINHQLIWSTFHLGNSLAWTILYLEHPLY